VPQYHPEIRAARQGGADGSPVLWSRSRPARAGAPCRGISCPARPISPGLYASGAAEAYASSKGFGGFGQQSGACGKSIFALVVGLPQFAAYISDTRGRAKAKREKQILRRLIITRSGHRCTPVGMAGRRPDLAGFDNCQTWNSGPRLIE
jgi:hypothetical protein